MLTLPDSATPAVPTPSSKLAILLWSTSPEQPALCASPFVYASIACALDCEVEIHFAGTSVRLLQRGLADSLVSGSDPHQDKSIYRFMQEAHQAGARFLACSMALRQHLPAETLLIPELAGHAGATAFIIKTLAPDWRTLVF